MHARRGTYRRRHHVPYGRDPRQLGIEMGGRLVFFFFFETYVPMEIETKF